MFHFKEQHVNKFFAGNLFIVSQFYQTAIILRRYSNLLYVAGMLQGWSWLTTPSTRRWPISLEIIFSSANLLRDHLQLGQSA